MFLLYYLQRCFFSIYVFYCMILLTALNVLFCCTYSIKIVTQIFTNFPNFSPLPADPGRFRHPGHDRLAAGIAACQHGRQHHKRNGGHDRPRRPRQQLGRPDGHRGEPVAVRGAQARPRPGRLQAAGFLGGGVGGRQRFQRPLGWGVLAFF